MTSKSFSKIFLLLPLFGFLGCGMSADPSQTPADRSQELTADERFHQATVIRTSAVKINRIAAEALQLIDEIANSSRNQFSFAEELQIIRDSESEARRMEAFLDKGLWQTSPELTPMMHEAKSNLSWARDAIAVIRARHEQLGAGSHRHAVSANDSPS